MIDKKIKEKLFFYINRMKELKGNTNRLLNTYNLYNYLILEYDEINYLELKRSCYTRVIVLLNDIIDIKINYFYKKKVINKLLEFKLLYENKI